MKKWTIHIYIIALLASLLVSCSSILDEESIQAKDKVGITFTLSMNSVGATSRSLDPTDKATEYENTIREDMFRVLAYTKDGVHEVTIFSMDKISNTTYQISGELKGNHSVDKVVILANCGKSSDLPSTPLNMLTYSFLGSDFNPENPQSYIPMWGVKKIEVPLVPGTSTNIGTINLLRAMAKIQVAMSDRSTSTLTKVVMTKYNNGGACVPSSFDNMKETADIEEATIPTGTTSDSNLAFFPMSDKSYMLYLPEYKKEGNPSISVTVKDINGEVHDKEVQFGEYDSGAFTNIYWDILRNHYYKFNLILEVASDGKLALEVKTEEYAGFELYPVYGD